VLVAGGVLCLDLELLVLVHELAAYHDEVHSPLSGNASLTFLLLRTTLPLLRRGHLETLLLPSSAAPPYPPSPIAWRRNGRLTHTSRVLFLDTEPNERLLHTHIPAS
jgi:hypothetical protein